MGDSSPAPFEDAVQLAVAVCAAPLALAILPGPDRLRIRASAGPVSTEMPPEFGFSALVLAAREPIVIPDTRLDPRGAGNAALGPPWFARFYAGVPFLTSDGRALGVLEIYDHVPRGLEAWQMDGLLRLARIVSRTIESWSAQREREARRSRTLASLAGGLAAELKRGDAAAAATSRAADLARQLLAVAGHRSLRPGPVDLNALVTGLSRSRPPSGGAEAWSLALDPSAGQVYGDAERIGRAICGLAARARATGNGPVPIATRDVQLPDAASEGALLPPGRYVMVTIGAPPPAASEEIAAWFAPAAADPAEGPDGDEQPGIAEVSGLMFESGGRLGMRGRRAGGPAFCLALPRMT
jgi:hypothetical protein